ncbi:MAG: hypothetical protein KDD36_07610 [Flavobacteriales bacterium]|nr:hypothetical protein [Flavobacteriales bacterium]
MTLVLACKKDTLPTDREVTLRFSQDTVIFDTVFTTIGSATQYLKVFNPEKSAVNLSDIRLARGSASKFRMNVDGVPGIQFQDVEIPAEDSIYIFLEVTLDPNNMNTPLIVTDSILFTTHGNVQDVDLVAWGQDAYFHAPPPGYSAFFLNTCNTVWNNDKPHVVYGYALIDTSCSLTINAGAGIYFHANSGLIALSNASLHINGTATDPVRIEGDRLDPPYEDIPGQWGRIWLSAGSVDNTVDYAIIRNGSVGIHADTVGNTNPTVTLRNTVIENMSIAGILAQGARIEGENLMVSNCGEYVLALALGGDYKFRHCTFANEWSYEVRQTALLGISNWYEDVDKKIQHRDLTQAYFGNCIIYGTQANEVDLSLKAGALSNYFFENCIMKVDGTVNINDGSHFQNITKVNPLFQPDGIYTYALDSLSPAVDKGLSTITNDAPIITVDITGNTRTQGTGPDIGAFEKR